MIHLCGVVSAITKWDIDGKKTLSFKLFHIFNFF
jgi:hypothetical protein